MVFEGIKVVGGSSRGFLPYQNFLDLAMPGVVFCPNAPEISLLCEGEDLQALRASPCKLRHFIHSGFWFR